LTLQKDSSEGELADTEDHTNKGKQVTPTPQTFPLYAMTSTQAQTTTTAPASGSGLVVQTIPLGGGGGGGGGGRGGGGGIPTGGSGAPAGPPALTGKLGGNPPKEFHRDREESKSFLLNFLLY